MKSPLTVNSWHTDLICFMVSVFSSSIINTAKPFCVRRSILQDRKEKYAPQTPEDELHPHFVEACHMLECTQYMLDLLTIGSHEERTKLVNDMMKDNKITLLQDHLREIKEESNEQS